MKELADRIVALGVGTFGDGDEGPRYFTITSWTNSSIEMIGVSADKFTQSWEVAGALIEECERRGIDWILVLCEMSENAANESNESVPHAINLACVEALEAA